MSLGDKSLEELKRCNEKLADEIRARNEKKILENGGFRCIRCDRVFERKDESKTHPGMCYSDGHNALMTEIRDRFEGIENLKLPMSVDLIDIAFARSRMETKAIELDYQGGFEYAAVVDSLILKIGDEYMEVSVKIPNDPDGDDCKITLQMRGIEPPVREARGNIFRWKWPQPPKGRSP